jgi:hypothetical protein
VFVGTRHDPSAQRAPAWWRIQYVPGGKTASVFPSHQAANACRYRFRNSFIRPMASMRFHLSRQAMRGLRFLRGSRVLGRANGLCNEGFDVAPDLGVAHRALDDPSSMASPAGLAPPGPSSPKNDQLRLVNLVSDVT